MVVMTCVVAFCTYLMFAFTSAGTMTVVLTLETLQRDWNKVFDLHADVTKCDVCWRLNGAR